MLEQLQALADRYAELEAKSADPSLMTDRDAYTALMKEFRGLEPTVTKYRRYLTVCREEKEAKALLSSPDPELSSLAEEECNALEIERTELETAAQRPQR